MAGKTQARVAAIQWADQAYASFDALAASLPGPLEEAARAGAELVAFSAGPGDALARLLAAQGGE